MTRTQRINPDEFVNTRRLGVIRGLFASREALLIAPVLLWKANLARRRAKTRRWLTEALASRENWSRKSLIIVAALIFLVSFVVRSLHAADLEPLMYTRQQPFSGLTMTYDARAVSILAGEGLLGPYDINPRRTIWLAQAPGYAIFLSGVYRLTSRNFFHAQLLQNGLNSLSSVLIFLIAGLLLSWRVGVAAGFLSAVSHHLSHISNFMLPDSVSALPILLAFLLLVIERRYGNRFPGWRSFALYAAAGLALGIAAWLRSQTMLLGVVLMIALCLLSTRRLVALKRAALLAVVSLLALAPITIKNYVVYGEFVPVNIGAGIVLWEGIGEESGDRFGAVATDEEVAMQDAALYNEPRYAGTWASPDGIMRDRERVRRSLAIIRKHPFWYAGVMFGRARRMMKYSADAPLVYRLSEAGALTRSEPIIKEWRELADASAPSSASLGRSLALTRPLARPLQRLSKEAMLPFILLGMLATALVSLRRAAFLLITPVYYFIFQGFFHTEFRYTLPMQYFLFTFAAVAWVVLLVVIGRACKRLLARRRSVSNAA